MTNTHSRMVWTAVATMFFGCSNPDRILLGHGDTATAPMAGEDSPMLQFCERLQNALCEHEKDCGCTVDDSRSCEEQAVASCASNHVERQAAIDGAIANGTIVYRPEAIDALLARLAEQPMSCDSIAADFKLDSLSASAWNGVFTGTVEAGAVCAIRPGHKAVPQDCKEGLLCTAWSDGTSRCVTLVGPGEACDTGADASRRCFQRRAPDRDGEFETAYDLYVCIPTAAGAATGTCQTQLDNGQPCDAGVACRSGFCTGSTPGAAVCSAKLPNGEACGTGAACLSGACKRNADGGVCIEPLANGEPCENDDQRCASGSCHASPAEEAGVGGGVCGLKEERPAGSPCSNSNECAAKLCKASTCQERICGQ